MKKTVYAILLISVLMLSASAVVSFLVVPASANFIPETPPQGIKINSDGSVEGSNMLKRNGNVYTFTGNINETIVVLCNNVVLDGAGFTLQGNGASTGVFFQDQSGVVIKNLNIQGFTIGIKSTIGYFYWELERDDFGSNSIIGNNITSNAIGVFLCSKANTFVTDNHVENNTCGITLNSNGVLRGNRFNNNPQAINEDVYSVVNDIDTSNIVNGKPICYWVNIHDKTVPSDAGLVTLKNCTGITVENLQLEDSSSGIFLLYTNYSTIKNNVFIHNSNGITIKCSSNNLIEGNSILENNANGIYISSSSDIFFLNNKIVNNTAAGIDVDFETANLTITKNEIAENGGNGVFIDHTSDSTISNNVITQNGGYGLGFGHGPNVTVKSNIISKNNAGISINAQDSTIIFNNVTDNKGYAVYIEGNQKNNILHHNNFINNNITDGSQAFIRMHFLSALEVLELLTPGQTPGLIPDKVDGEANIWDNGKEGNYWSNYQTRYPDASKTETTGSTPYFINSKNQDNHPLLAPVENINTDLPFNQPSTELPGTPDQLDSLSTPPSNSQPEPVSPILLTTGCGLIVGFVGVAVIIYFKHKKPLKSA
jgi:parallel beta-helix repeat protein